MKTKFIFAAFILGMSLSFTSCYMYRDRGSDRHEQKLHNHHHGGDEDGREDNR